MVLVWLVIFTEFDNREINLRGPCDSDFFFYLKIAGTVESISAYAA